MYCTKCGTKLEENAKFCHFCGKAVIGRQAAISYKDLFSTVLERHDLKTDHEKALAEFEKYCDEQPDTAEKFFWLGNLQYTIGGASKNASYIDKAIATYEKALQLKPNYPQVYSNLIGAHMSIGNTDEVLSVAKRWLQIDPSNETAKAIIASPVAKQKEAMKHALSLKEVATGSARPKFDPWTSGGICDVCGKPLRAGAAFKIPVDVFYSSPKYRHWFELHAMPKLRAMGAPSYFTVDVALANMRSKDKTPYSAVCDGCVKLFL